MNDIIASAVSDRMMAGTLLPDHVPSFLPSGIYFGLDELTYHDDPAAGSTDMGRLWKSPPDYWFNSGFNPLWEPEEETDAFKFGTATHVAILEGIDAFRALYYRITESRATKAGKVQQEHAEFHGLRWLKAKDYDRVLLMAGMVRSNPTLQPYVSDGVASEVSIFWTGKSGLRKKARFDYLKPGALVDLKTLSNRFDDEFEEACRKQMVRYHYFIQAQHYAEGRAQISNFVDAGAVFGDRSKIDLEKLVFTANRDRFAWVFLFVQSTGAPLTLARKLSAVISKTGDGGRDLIMRNPILDAGAAAIAKAEENFRIFCDRFDGLSLPWVLDEPVVEWDIESFAPWSFS